MEKARNKLFLSTDEMAGRLGIKKSWLYRACMRRGPGSIPRVKVGKYTKFDEKDVVAWIRQQSEEALS
jgi:excisionase family DNA binding protein